MTQRRLVAAALTLVVLAVIGLIYLQVVAQSRATREAWLLTHDVSAGALLDGSNVKKVRVPLAGDQFSLLQESPMQRRTAHRLAMGDSMTPAYRKTLLAANAWMDSVPPILHSVAQNGSSPVPYEPNGQKRGLIVTGPTRTGNPFESARAERTVSPCAAGVSITEVSSSAWTVAVSE